ncbi:MAG: hypothetical protein JXB38_19290 [Anaerolineales bacterium]|nr:hypothetical protein [Anaerolineales bacterium]
MRNITAIFTNENQVDEAVEALKAADILKLDLEPSTQEINDKQSLTIAVDEDYTEIARTIFKSAGAAEVHTANVETEPIPDWVAQLSIKAQHNN